MGGTLQSLKFDMGLHYDNIPYVKIPDSLLSLLNDKMRRLHKRVEQNSFSIKEKVFYKILKKDRESVQHKADQLMPMLLNEEKYLEDMKNWFQGCKGIKTVEKHLELIKQKINSLKKYQSPKKQSISNNTTVFPKEAYSLSFVDKKREVIGPGGKKIDISASIDSNTKYKSRCMIFFSNMRLVFSLYLSQVNDVYSVHLTNIQEPALTNGTWGKFNSYKRKLDQAIQEYDKSVSAVSGLIDKHSKYYNWGNNRKAIKDALKKLEENRDVLVKKVSSAKRNVLDARFINRSEEEPIYKNFMDMVENTNDLLNNLAKSISNGEYEEFEPLFNEIIKLFDGFSVSIDEFSKISASKNEKAYEILSGYENMVKRSNESIGQQLNKVKQYSAEFEKSYRKFESELRKNIVSNIIKTVLNILGSLIHWGAALSNIYDMHERTLRGVDSGKHVPKIDTD